MVRPLRGRGPIVAVTAMIRLTAKLPRFTAFSHSNSSSSSSLMTIIRCLAATSQPQSPQRPPRLTPPSRRLLGRFNLAELHQNLPLLALNDPRDLELWLNGVQHKTKHTCDKGANQPETLANYSKALSLLARKYDNSGTEEDKALIHRVLLEHYKPFLNTWFAETAVHIRASMMNANAVGNDSKACNNASVSPGFTPQDLTVIATAFAQLRLNPIEIDPVWSQLYLTCLCELMRDNRFNPACLSGLIAALSRDLCIDLCEVICTAENSIWIATFLRASAIQMATPGTNFLASHYATILQSVACQRCMHISSSKYIRFITDWMDKFFTFSQRRVSEFTQTTETEFFMSTLKSLVHLGYTADRVPPSWLRTCLSITKYRMNFPDLFRTEYFPSLLTSLARLKVVNPDKILLPQGGGSGSGSSGGSIGWTKEFLVNCQARVLQHGSSYPPQQLQALLTVLAVDWQCDVTVMENIHPGFLKTLLITARLQVLNETCSSKWLSDVVFALGLMKVRPESFGGAAESFLQAATLYFADLMSKPAREPQPGDVSRLLYGLAMMGVKSPLPRSNNISSSTLPSGFQPMIVLEAASKYLRELKHPIDVLFFTEKQQLLVCHHLWANSSSHRPNHNNSEQKQNSANESFHLLDSHIVTLLATDFAPLPYDTTKHLETVQGIAGLLRDIGIKCQIRYCLLGFLEVDVYLPSKGLALQVIDDSTSIEWNRVGNTGGQLNGAQLLRAKVLERASVRLAGGNIKHRHVWVSEWLASAASEEQRRVLLMNKIGV